MNSAVVSTANGSALGAEWTRVDAQTLEFHKRVREGYDALIAAEIEAGSSRWVRIDASQSVEHVQRHIREALSGKLVGFQGDGPPESRPYKKLGV